MKKQAIPHSVWAALGVAWMLFIWSNSLQTAAESSVHSRGVLALLMPLLSRTGLPEELWHTLVRKLGHLTEFALLGLLWTKALSSERAQIPGVRWTRRGWTLFLCMAVALTDETIQLFVEGRGGQLPDVWIDTLGGALGILAAMAFRWLRRRGSKN